MSLQPIHLPDYPHVRIIGDVHIDPTVAIAPGTILHAAPGCQIILASGVCLGMGVIIKAYGGQIQLDEGVSLGPGVLLMGPSHLGSNACIGGLSTLWHTTIEALAVIPAGSVVGDPTRQVNLLQIDENQTSTQKQPAIKQMPAHPAATVTPTPPTPPLRAMAIADPWETQPSTSSGPEASPSELETTPEPTPPQPPAPTQPAEVNPPPVTKKPGQPAYGKVMLNQLLITLLPHRQPSD